jgi:hypothetical protein
MLQAGYGDPRAVPRRPKPASRDPRVCGPCVRGRPPHPSRQAGQTQNAHKRRGLPESVEARAEPAQVRGARTALWLVMGTAVVSLPLLTQRRQHVAEVEQQAQSPRGAESARLYWQWGNRLDNLLLGADGDAGFFVFDSFGSEVAVVRGVYSEVDGGTTRILVSAADIQWTPIISGQAGTWAEVLLGPQEDGKRTAVFRSANGGVVQTSTWVHVDLN